MSLPVPGHGVGMMGRCPWRAAILVVLFLTTTTVAQFAEPVMWVEEDWELVLMEPDGDLLAPQFHTVMSPFNNLDSHYAQVTWNYWEVPQFAPGGFQVQGWDHGEVVRLKDLGSEKFNVNAETVTWTQALASMSGEMWFAILAGQSVTWGSFGGLGTVIGGMTGVWDLNDYSPDVSVANSWVTYGANRVSSLKITEVRYYSETDLLYTDTTPRVVYQCE